MGIIDSIVKEVTKWTLSKVEKKVDISSNRYKKKVFELYDTLYYGDEYIVELIKNKKKYLGGFWPINEKYEDIPKSSLSEGYKWDQKELNLYSIRATFNNDTFPLKLKIDRSIRIFEKIKKTLIMESGKGKHYWDKFLIYLTSIKNSLKLAGDQHFNYIAHQKEEEYFIFIKLIISFYSTIEDNKLLKNYIKEYTNYMNIKWPPKIT